MDKDVIEAVGAVNIAAAANRLGVSEATLETVLERGLLKGFRDPDGGWMVLLEPLASNGSSPPSFSVAREATKPGTGLSRILDDSRSSIERVLAEQVEFLRSQLADRERAVADKDRLIAELTRAARGLPAPRSEEGPAARPPAAAASADAALQSELTAALLHQLAQQGRGRDSAWVSVIVVTALIAVVLVFAALGAGPWGPFPAPR